MKKLRILHIDDNIHDRMLVRDALERENDQFEVVEADSREKFEKYISEGDFDLVLSDFNILGFDGLQVLKVVMDKKPEIPVIIVTGTGSEEIAIQAMKMGASDYVIKSVSHIKGLAHAIQMVIKNKIAQNERNSAIAAQRESEELYRSIYKNTSVAILLTSPDGRVLSANDFACKLFERTEAEICMAGRLGLIDMTDIRLYDLLDERRLSGQASGELTFLKKDGTKFQAEVSSALFKDKDDQERSTMVIRDLTERKLAERQLMLLSSAIEQSPTSIIITDAMGKIEFVNNKFTSSMQYSLDEVKGKNPMILNAGHIPEEVFNIMWETLREGNVWRGEYKNQRKDGSYFWENVIISPLVRYNGIVSNYIIIMEDITEKKRMLDELIISKNKAEESDRLKTAFLHNVSHEIRTPMNAIIGFSNFLKDPGLFPEKRDIFTDIIIQSSNQLLSIITDIIDIATIEAGQEIVHEKEVNLNAILRLLYDQYVLKIQKTDITLSYSAQLTDQDSIITSDEMKITAILSNLINNAVKFTNHGSIEFGYTKKENFLEFYVKDTGIGIVREMHDEIFKRFRQVDLTENRSTGGSGLGLSISKDYVEMLGGKIWLTSNPCKGSSFYFTIPYVKTISDKSNMEKSSNELNYKNEKIKTILIAEDEDSNFMLLVELLSGLKINIDRAINGVEAVNICKSNPLIDMVLMDIKMPEMDGYEATKLIKKFCPDLPILAQSAYINESDKKKAIDSGCYDLISKPINKKHLLSKIIYKAS